MPCMKYLDNDNQKGAVQARCECSDKIACFDVSPEMDYMVCECRDETIHLFSLKFGTKVWVQPSSTQRKYWPRELSGNGAYRQIGHSLSFYHSVIFHPNGKSVLPGTLRYVYTISGDREDLYPDSDCSFSNCVVRSLSDTKNIIFTTCYTEPKRINIWDLENGQLINQLIECNAEITSFAISEDGSLIAISDITNTITVFDVDNQSGLKLPLGKDDYQSVCGLMQFTSDNNTLVCCFLYWQCDEAGCLLEEERKPRFTFITPVNNISLPDPHFETLEFRTFLLWPFVPPNTLTQSTFMGQNEGPSWVSKVQREIPHLFSGSYISLSDENILVGSPDHKYVTMLNVGQLQRESDSTYTSNVNMGVRKIIFSMEGDAIYAMSSRERFVSSNGVLTITVWKMSSREFLKTKQFYGPVSILPKKEGLVVFKKDREAELWNFDLSECIRTIVKLSNTDILYKVRIMPVSDELIAFFYPLSSCESIYIRSSQQSPQNEESSESKEENEEYLNFLKLFNMHAYRIDFIDLTSVGGKLVSSLSMGVGAKEYVDHVSCSSCLGEVLVCTVEDISKGLPIDNEKLTVSLRKNGIIKWERNTEYVFSPFQQHMIFSPRNEFVVTWNTLDRGQGIHVLQAETGQTLHVFLRDQKDIIECKFLDDESLVCCSGENFLRLYNVRTGDLLSGLDIGEQPFCLGACLYHPLIAIGLSGTRIKFVHVQLPTESKKKK